MTLTSEQNEAWQKAINLLDHLDFHALSGAGLLESKSRLANLGVPKWAIPLRAQLITQGWYVQDREPWVPDFVLRSEVALVGLQIRHPIPEDAELAERRLVLRFVAEALRPFVEHARHADWYRRNGYTAIVNLFHLCERSSATGSITRWPRDLRTYPKSFFCDLLLLCNPRRDQSKVEEVYGPAPWATTCFPTSKA